jgi:drug/metabolite transporter (DMT)-like permease
VNDKENKHLSLLFLMTLLFGLSFIASKQALQGLGIFQLVFCRYLLALLLLSTILWKDRKKLIIARKDWKYFLLLTMVEPVGYFIFETFGIRYTSPSNVSLIIATIPIFTLIFAALMIREKISRRAFGGVLLSLAGVYFIVSHQQGTTLAPSPVLGNLLAMGAAISAGFYNVLCRRITRTYSPLTITYYQSIVATIVFFPLATIETFFRESTYIDGSIILSIFYLGFGSSVAAYFLLNFTLSRLPTYRVAIFANLIPVVTIFASWLIFREFLRPMQFFGAVLILLGIYLASFRIKLNKISANR